MAGQPKPRTSTPMSGSSKIETLLVGGALDFATPPQVAAKELLPYLPNGHLLRRFRKLDLFCVVAPNNERNLPTKHAEVVREAAHALRTPRPCGDRAPHGPEGSRPQPQELQPRHRLRGRRGAGCGRLRAANPVGRRQAPAKRSVRVASNCARRRSNSTKQSKSPSSPVAASSSRPPGKYRFVLSTNAIAGERGARHLDETVGWFPLRM